jgi:hypothetical protein
MRKPRPGSNLPRRNAAPPFPVGKRLGFGWNPSGQGPIPDLVLPDGHNGGPTNEGSGGSHTRSFTGAYLPNRGGERKGTLGTLSTFGTAAVDLVPARESFCHNRAASCTSQRTRPRACGERKWRVAAGLHRIAVCLEAHHTPPEADKVWRSWFVTLELSLVTSPATRGNS